MRKFQATSSPSNTHTFPVVSIELQIEFLRDLSKVTSSRAEPFSWCAQTRRFPEAAVPSSRACAQYCGIKDSFLLTTDRHGCVCVC